MPFIVDDYARDTAHLTLEEHGAYLLLLMSMWRHKGSIPDDDLSNSRMLGLSPRMWLRMKPRLMPFFEAYGPLDARIITQKKLQKMWNYAVENSRKQSTKGKLGAKARYEKNQILRSVHGHSHGNGTGIATVDSRGHSTGTGTGLASKKERNITTTSNSPATVAEEATEKPAEDFPEMPTALNRLLDTPLMRRTS